VTLHQLKIFAAIATRLNITKASKDLHLAPPSVREQMKSLESELHSQLYRRAGSGIELTEEGRSFLRDAEPILSSIAKLKGIFEVQKSGAKAASLTIGGTHSPSTAVLPEIIAVYLRSHPGVGLTLRTDTSQGIVKLLTSCEIDIGVVTHPPDDPSMISVLWRRERLVAFVSAAHAVARKDIVAMTDLAHLPLVMKSKGSGAEQFLRQIRNSGLEPNIAMRCESPEAVKAAVKNQIGLGLLYEQVIKPDIKRGDLKVLRIPDLKITVWTSIIYRKDASLSAPAREFLTLMQRWAQGQEKTHGRAP